MESLLRPVLTQIAPYVLRCISAFTSGPEKAVEDLKDKGLNIIQEYAQDKPPTAERIAQAVSYSLVPVKSLFAAGLTITGGLYLLSKVTSFLPIVPSLCKIGWLATAYLTYEIYTVYSHLCSMYGFFREYPEDKPITQDQFIKHVNNYCRDILARTPFLSTMVEGVKEFKSVGTLIKALIDNEKDNKGKGEGQKTSPVDVVMQYVPKLGNTLMLGQFVMTTFNLQQHSQEPSS